MITGVSFTRQRRYRSQVVLYFSNNFRYSIRLDTLHSLLILYYPSYYSLDEFALIDLLPRRRYFLLSAPDRLDRPAVDIPIYNTVAYHEWSAAIFNPRGKRIKAGVNAKITRLVNHRGQMVAIRFFPSAKHLHARGRERESSLRFRMDIAARVLFAIIST